MSDQEEEEEDQFILFYNCPQEVCACVDENGDHTRIARRFSEFYQQVKPKKFGGKGRKAVDVLDEMGILRSCCRILFLNLPLVPMIDRSKNRFYNDIFKTVISEDTRVLRFKREPPEFPIL